MQLKMNSYQLPEKVSFNFEELKSEISEKLSIYETSIYTDDQIKQAKADRADLNRLKKALNDERIRREKEYMQPFNEFKSQVNEIIKMIEKPVSAIDKQIKAVEDQRKAEKKEKVLEYLHSMMNEIPAGTCFPHNEKWWNSSTSMKSIQEEIDSRIEQIKKDLDTLSNLPEFSFEAIEVYKSSLDIGKALNEANRLSEQAKRKAEYEAEQERKKAEEDSKKQEDKLPGQFEFNDNESFERYMNPPVENHKEPEREWIGFKAFLTVEDAKALKEFFETRNIQFEAV